MTTTTLYLTTDKLVISPRNMRKSGPGDVSSLEASIPSAGLIHALKVLPVAKPKKKGPSHEIVAGGRRFTAIRNLISSGVLEKSYGVRCDVVTEEEADEITLAENEVREQAPPVDQFEAYKRLRERGHGVATIAAKFGVTESIVEKRLRLGNLAPALLDAMREERLTLEQAMAFAVSDDHARQLAAYEALGDDAAAWRIRDSLTEGHVPGSDKRARFVGVEPYREAGGETYADLFDRQEGVFFFTDAALLDRLAREKLEAVRREVAQEGWTWSACSIDGLDHQAYPQRLYPEQGDLSSEDAAEHERLLARQSELSEALEENDNEEKQEEYDDVTARIEALEETALRFSPEAMARAGVVVVLSRLGEAQVERGVLRKEDAKAQRAAEREGKPSASGLSDSLQAELAALRTGMIGACLQDNPSVALVAVTHALTLSCFYPHAYDAKSALAISARPPRAETLLHADTKSRAFDALAAAHDVWTQKLPENPADLWTWCSAQPQETLLALLAQCAAQSVDATKGATSLAAGRAAADALADAAGAKAEHWHSLAELNLFARTPKAFTLSLVREHISAARADDYAKRKKADLAARATEALEGKWLPEALMRSASPAPAQAEATESGDSDVPPWEETAAEAA